MAGRTSRRAGVADGEAETQVGLGTSFHLVPTGEMGDEGEAVDLDAEQAWDEWGEALRNAESSGLVRVYKIPFDQDGNPLVNTKGARQVHLGSWEHQQYSFDDLCAMLRVKFMRPGETMAIRIAGITPGERGVKFNRILTLQRDATEAPTAAHGGSEVQNVLRAMQETQAQTAAMMERILSPRVEMGPSGQWLDTLTKVLGATAPIIAPALAALISRPKPKSEIGELISAMAALKDMAAGGDGSGNAEESTTLGIIKAVAPGALQLFTALATQQQAALVSRTQTTARRLPPNAATARRPDQQPIPTAPAADVPAESAAALDTMSESTVPETSSENTAMLAQLKPQLEQLAELAAQGADPKETAKLVMDLMPSSAEMDDQLYKLVETPDNFARRALLSAKVREYREWFEALRVAILAEFEPDKTDPA